MMNMHINKAMRISLILALAILLLPVQNVFALGTCYASTCNNKNPTQYVCQNDAYTAVAKWATAASGTVRMDLRYSPQCAANWTRATNESPGQVRRLRAELWNSNKTTLLMSYEDSIYVYIYTNMYDGTVVRCGKAKQGPVGSGFDAITAFGCA